MTDDDVLLDGEQVAEMLGCSHRTVQRLRTEPGRDGLPYVRVGPQLIRYRRADVVAFIERRLRRSTSDPGPADGRGMTDAAAAR